MEAKPPSRERLVELDVDPDQPHAYGVCPGCGGLYLAGSRVTDPRARTLWHSVPPCERFTALPPVGFLQWARTEGSRVTTPRTR